MRITGTHINYYFICKRKLWLYSNGIQLEQENSLVQDGLTIHEYTYPQRNSKYEEVSLEGIKVDFYDARKKIIHEIKRSHKLEEAHIWQLKYYIYIFEKHGIEGVKGLLEYPTEKITKEIELKDNDYFKIREIVDDIELICSKEECPPIVKLGRCKKCAFYDFCYIKEEVK
ncbi:CRISPR-associated protein Cas4 [Marinilabiliaceae bacterium JC040]|nr:CRISPR-associated protein Cas4 [Marinilabiliaceae bacterium JC040]